MANIWKRIACVRDDRPAEYLAAVDELAMLQEARTTHTQGLRLLNLLSLGFDAHEAAIREYRYALALAISSSYLPSHCVWRGHLLGG